MHKLEISQCKLDLTADIIDFNQNFSKLFDIQTETKVSFMSHFNLNTDFLNDIKSGDKKSYILFYNTKINKTTEDNAISLFYVIVEKNDNSYRICLTNWLNWIHNINASLDSGYSMMSKFNDTFNKTDFNRISDSACYKALYPLLTFLPKQSSTVVGQMNLFKIMRVFVKLREINYSRDYARNVYSRIRTSLKKEYGYDYTDAIDLIKNKEMLNINYNGEILIPNTTLVSNIIYPVCHDEFIISIIESINS